MQPPTGLALIAAQDASPAPLRPLIGFVLARVAADEAEILSIAVAAEDQRRGLGHRLLDRAIGELRPRGATRLFLEVAADNVAAQALYAALHFAEIGRRCRYYARRGAPAVDALVLGRDL
jgi:ribosomal-protein-alanine N-acetyltransferase